MAIYWVWNWMNCFTDWNQFDFFGRFTQVANSMCLWHCLIHILMILDIFIYFASAEVWDGKKKRDKCQVNLSSEHRYIISMKQAKVTKIIHFRSCFDKSFYRTQVSWSDLCVWLSHTKWETFCETLLMRLWLIKKPTWY